MSVAEIGLLARSTTSSRVAEMGKNVFPNLIADLSAAASVAGDPIGA
jgi:hypothetical protein